MRLISLILITVVFNCMSQEIVKLNDNIYANSLEKLQINGIAKELIHYKLKTNSNLNSESIDTVILRKFEFTDFGKVNYSEFYNDFGEIVEITDFKFSDDNLLRSRRVRNSKTKTNIEDSLEYIYKNNQIIYRAKVNSNPENNVVCKYTFDKYNNPIELTNTQFNNITTTTYKNEYNSSGKLLIERQLTNNKNHSSETTNFYKYDNSGKLKEQIVIVDNKENFKIHFEYDSIKGTKKVQYFQNRQIVSEKTYDNNSNIILTKNFENQLLAKEIEYNYKEFDKYNNWLERTEKSIDYSKKDNTITYNTVEKREIKYYKQ